MTANIEVDAVFESNAENNHEELEKSHAKLLEEIAKPQYYNNRELS